MVTPSLQDFENEVKRGLIRPIYLLIGPEEYERKRAVDVLKQHAVPSEVFTFNYSELSLRTNPSSAILEAAQTFPVASPRRLVVVTELEALAPEKHEGLINYVKQPASKTVLVLVAAEIDRRTGLYRALKENACIREFPKPKGVALERWAEQYMRRHAISIATASLKKLVALAGSDLETLVGEIDKLILYAGKEKAIPDSAVDELVRGSRQHSIFKLTEAIGRRDRQAALHLLASLLESDERPTAIATLIARHFRQLLIAREMLAEGRRADEIAAQAQIQHFVLDEMMRQARTFDWSTAQRVYTRMAAIDHQFKSTSQDQRMILENLICSF